MTPTGASALVPGSTDRQSMNNNGELSRGPGSGWRQCTHQYLSGRIIMSLLPTLERSDKRPAK